MITQEKINEAVDNCEWARYMCDVRICGADIVPCYKHINDGGCDTLKRLLAEDSDDNEA